VSGYDRFVQRVLALLFVLALFSSTYAVAPEFDIPSVTIADGDLPMAVRLAPADADALRRRVNTLPRLEGEPAVDGPSYTVTTSYWPVAIRLEDDEDELDVSVAGRYYPQGGYVLLTLDDLDDASDDQDPEDVWVVINLRQRAILDRYIQLAKAGLIGEAPSTIDVLAAVSSTEVLGVQAGAGSVTQATAAAILRSLSEANPSPLAEEREPPFLDDSGFWLTVTLVEGRSLRYYYREGVLTEALGTERYDGSAVADLLASITPEPPPAIKQEEPVGSLLWWPVMIGGGLVAIGAAIWLRRKSRPSGPATFGQ
jgi:hypothetical protein